MIRIDIASDAATPNGQQQRLREAVRAVLADATIRRAEISLAIVDDPTIHRLNRQYLNHDYATDVLSFALNREGDSLEGEIIVSHDTAARVAPSYGWLTDDELLLYAIHGALHLVGFDDSSPEAAEQMRRQEAVYLRRAGVRPPSEAERDSAQGPAPHLVSTDRAANSNPSSGESI